MRTALPAMLLCLIACKSGGPRAEKREAPSDAGGKSEVKAPRSRPDEPCVRVSTFPLHLPIAEASGAVYLSGASPTVLVVGDSGTLGQLIEVEPKTGKVLRTGRLPLDKGASDDIEGLAVRRGVLYGITSSGYVRHWERVSGGGFRLTRPAYPVAKKNKPLRMVCKSPHSTNCGRNYEGLCLLEGEVDDRACVGFVASKRDGRLYCVRLTAKKRKLRVEPKQFIAVSRPEALTGCHFTPDGERLMVGTNFFDRSRVYEVTGFARPSTARVRLVGVLGSGFPEAIAAGPAGVVYRFSDTGGGPSLVDKYICKGLSGPQD